MSNDRALADDRQTDVALAEGTTVLETVRTEHRARLLCGDPPAWT